MRKICHSAPAQWTSPLYTMACTICGMLIGGARNGARGAPGGGDSRARGRGADAPGDQVGHLRRVRRGWQLCLPVAEGKTDRGVPRLRPAPVEIPAKLDLLPALDLPRLSVV